MQLFPFYPSDLTVTADLTTGESTGIKISFEGDVSGIDFSGASGDELWRGTCVELFVKTPWESAYREFNIVPDGRHWMYELSGYRSIVNEAPLAQPPKVNLVVGSEGGEISVELPGIDVRNREVAVALITADCGGVRNFWGVVHSGDSPDFHAKENFRLCT